ATCDGAQRRVDDLVVAKLFDERADKRNPQDGGMEITHTLSSPPKVPAASGGSMPGLRYAARKPTNCWNRMTGPGASSASARPSIAWLCVSQPYGSTAWSAT